MLVGGACFTECLKHKANNGACNPRCSDTYTKPVEVPKDANGNFTTDNVEFTNVPKEGTLPWVCQDGILLNSTTQQWRFPHLDSLFGITTQNPDHPKQLGLQQDYSQEVTDKSGLAVQQNLDIINSQDQVDDRTATKRILIRQKVGATPGEPSTLQSEEIEHEYVNDMDIKMKTQY
jgi:hypothetical protein